jgi:hypothetical protein
MTMSQEEGTPLSLSVPAAGKKFYGLGTKGSYAAAKRGELVTVRVGRLLRVPVEQQEQRVKDLARAGYRDPGDGP